MLEMLSNAIVAGTLINRNRCIVLREVSTRALIDLSLPMNRFQLRCTDGVDTQFSKLVTLYGHVFVIHYGMALRHVTPCVFSVPFTSAYSSVELSPDQDFIQ